MSPLLGFPNVHFLSTTFFEPKFSFLDFFANITETVSRKLFLFQPNTTIMLRENWYLKNGLFGSSALSYL